MKSRAAVEAQVTRTIRKMKRILQQQMPPTEHLNEFVNERQVINEEYRESNIL